MEEVYSCSDAGAVSVTIRVPADGFSRTFRLGRPALVAEIVRSSRSGWYYRVIEPGVVAVGDVLKLEARPCPEWTVARVFDLIVGSAGKSDPAALKALGGLKPLSAEWRDRARRMAA